MASPTSASPASRDWRRSLARSSSSPAGGLGVAGEGGRPDGQERPPAGLGGDGREQPGLADPGLAGHEQQVAPPVGGRGEPPSGQGEEVVAAHQDR
jgi:hypothetical protein